MVLDPDLSVQQALRLVFTTFWRTGSACGVVRAFAQQGLKFPRRLRTGPHRGELVWGQLEHFRVLQILKNPRYAGAFFFGRTQSRLAVDGRYLAQKPPQEWYALVRDAHPGYISWENYEDNLRRLRENAQARGTDRRASPPREGPALLQGLAVCGICGKRMTVRYHSRRGQAVPEYLCHGRGSLTVALPASACPAQAWIRLLATCW